MAENRKQATQRGKILPDAVNIFLDGGQVFEGWKKVSIQKNLESIANQFTIQLHDRFEATGQNWPIKPGVGVKVNIGDERVITGRIEKMSVDYSAGSRAVSVSGRSFPGDLVDCSAMGSEFTQITLVDLAKQLVEPFGLKVFTSVEDKTIEKFGVKPGESVFEALNRAARLQGFFWISTRFGNIRLTRAARARATSKLVQDANIKSASMTIDESERHSEYIVKGQSQGLPNFNGANAAQVEGRAKDSGIGIYRPLITIAEGSVDQDAAQTRAQWEATNRLARGLDMNVTVEGWRQEDGSLWGINQLIRVKAPFLGINSNMLSTQITHTQDRGSGTLTTMSLVRPDSFSPKPEIKKKDDLLDKLGPGPK